MHLFNIHIDEYYIEKRETNFPKIKKHLEDLHFDKAFVTLIKINNYTSFSQPWKMKMMSPPKTKPKRRKYPSFIRRNQIKNMQKDEQKHLNETAAATLWLRFSRGREGERLTCSHRALSFHHLCRRSTSPRTPSPPLPHRPHQQSPLHPYL